MNYQKLNFCVMFLLVIKLTGIHAQSATTASGGEASGSGGIVSYSVGQVFYTYNSGTNGSVSQGVQQSYEVKVVNITGESANLNLFVHPNPTDNYLILKIDISVSTNLSFQLYDINGKLLENKGITDNETRILMNDRAPSLYFLKVIERNKVLKTFKIIKNQ